MVPPSQAGIVEIRSEQWSWLLQKLVDESGTQPSPQDVEGAIGFVRASADLRQRHGVPVGKVEEITQDAKSIP